MKAYIAVKFHKDCKNRKIIETISTALENAGIQTTVMVRDYEDWGKKSFPPQELMELTFELIDEQDLLIVDISEKGVGLGIEAGYAFAKKIPIIVVARAGSDISNTLKGIATEVIFYEKPSDLTQRFAELKPKTLK